MKRSTALAKRLEEVLLNGRWIANTNYKDEIDHITWAQATQKIGKLNTVAALIYHINYYLAGILNVFRGGELQIKDKYSFDLPPIESENEWKRLVDDFINNSEEFVKEVAEMPDTKLEELFVDEKYGTYQRNIEGVIEHSYYHLGQVSLIKKLITGNKE